MELLLTQAITSPSLQPRSLRHLSAREQEQLCGLSHPRRSAEYLTGRLAAKRVVGRLLNRAPADHAGTDHRRIEILSCPGHPPSVSVEGQPRQDLRLSISHSRNLILVGASVHGDLGVDLEHMHGRDWPLILRYMDWPLTLAPRHWPAEMFPCCLWTIYESGFKLHGGLVPSESFRVHSFALPSAGSEGSLSFVYEASFADRPFRGAGLIRQEWVAAVATGPAAGE